MGDVRVGQTISNPDGGPAKVIAKHPQGIKPIFKVTLRDGRSTRVTSDHLWQYSVARKTWCKSGLAWKVATTGQLKALIDSGVKPLIPMTSPVKFTVSYKSDMRKLDPYLLGVLLGDGCLSHRSITVCKPEDEIWNDLQRLGEWSRHGMVMRPLGELQVEIRKQLGRLKIDWTHSYDKFIPKPYLLGTVEDRLELLAGLIDTDGTVDKESNGFSYTTVSERLADDFIFLCRSLGCYATVSKRKAGYRKNGVFHQCLDAYTIYVSFSDLEIPCRVSRKKPKRYNGGRIERKIAVVSIEPDGEEEASCITVDNPNQLYLTDDFIVTHNSLLGCFWLLTLCFQFPGIRLFVGRKELKDLRATTWPSFLEAATLMGIDRRHLELHSQDSYLTVSNGNRAESRIDLIACAWEPSDPLYGRFGSYAYATGWLEESQEVPEMVFDTLKSRIGRCPVGNRNGVVPRILLTANPSKNFLYRLFYLPWRDAKEIQGHRFIQSLPGDNPYLPASYIRALESIRDVPTRERLLLGKWEYADDATLIRPDAVKDMLDSVVPVGQTPAITVDVARFGGDRTVMWLWKGSEATLLEAYRGKSLIHTAQTVKSHCQKFGVPMSHVVVDETGIGAGAVEMLPGCVPFVANWSASEEPDGTRRNFQNAKAEASYRFAEDVAARKVRVKFPDSVDGGDEAIGGGKLRDMLEAELGQLRSWKADTDGKLKVMPKDEVKQNLGRSPDFLDALILRWALPVSFTDWLPEPRGIDMREIPAEPHNPFSMS